MNKTATVKNCQPLPNWKDLFQWEVEMDNGDKGSNLTKTETQAYFIPGNLVEYEWIDGKFPMIKRVKKANYDKPAQSKHSQGGDKVQLYIIRQSSLKASIDFNNITYDPDNRPTRDSIIEDAEFFSNYVVQGLGESDANLTQTGRKDEPPDTGNVILQKDEPPPPTEDDLF